MNKKVEKYFSDKAIREKEKDEKIQQVIDQAKLYPKWRQQSIGIQEELTGAINGLKKELTAHQEMLEKIEQDNMRRERSKLRDRLLQSYRYFTSEEKNPAQAWSEMEAEAFWSMFKEYEEAKGDGHMHDTVQPAMRNLEEIPMYESGKIAQLMSSRK